MAAQGGGFRPHGCLLDTEQDEPTERTDILQLPFIDMARRRLYEFRFDGLWRSQKYPGSICNIQGSDLYWRGETVPEEGREARIHKYGNYIQVYDIYGVLALAGNRIEWEDGDTWERVHPFTPSGSGSGSRSGGTAGATLSSSSALPEAPSPASLDETIEQARNYPYYGNSESRDAWAVKKALFDYDPVEHNNDPNEYLFFWKNEYLLVKPGLVEEWAWGCRIAVPQKEGWVPPAALGDAVP